MSATYGMMDLDTPLPKKTVSVVAVEISSPTPLATPCDGLADSPIDVDEYFELIKPAVAE